MSKQGRESAVEGGYTLVEVLVAVVVVGVMSAIALEAVSHLTDKGGSAACYSSMGAAEAATSAYYAASHGAYPQTFAQLTSSPAGQPLLASSGGTAAGTTTLKGKGGWTLTMRPGPTVSDQTTFSGC